MAEGANPRTMENPDAAEFTRRHARFYDYLQVQDESGAGFAFKSLRSWAYARCRKDEDFMMVYQKLREKPLGLDEMDELATLMKVAWHDQGLWEWGRDEIEELRVPVTDGDRATINPQPQ